MMCQKCGKESESGNHFCMICGTPFKEDIVTSIPMKRRKTKKKIPIILGILIIVIVITLFFIKILIPRQKSKENNYSHSSSDEIISIVKDENGIAKFIDEAFTNQLVKNESDALTALNSLKNELKFQDVNEEFEITNVEVSEDITYYKFKQKYKETDIYNTNLIISVDKNGTVLSMSGYYIPNINIDINAKKTKEELENIVTNDLGEGAKIISSSKEIYADNENQILVFVIYGYSDTKPKEYLVDANSGEIIISTDLLDYSKPYEFKGQGMNGLETVTIEEFYDLGTLKTRYHLMDPTRNIIIVDARQISTDLGGLYCPPYIHPGHQWWEI